ncbi:PPOX class F420-dependent oxidoreductase [Streptomyces sp. H10-C2]|uniref:PPOX class F420-dependent oxidoreductase n=1 Tax=unclassified Streptomyces TaxID=2593676 RepID=UPI0024BB29A1|nr:MULTISPECIES: PPOX class F420-dependent oxidoreductase [unclassified Streptomyces]MDJ0343129.1 PPOX class F420-dependent oxidoreductase [Streptomyces sp. PH10-H1]MDJ0371071.1 PPOX class F420-dependent oxidoreductase [Streptomyces sp. H10-C2]
MSQESGTSPLLDLLRQHPRGALVTLKRDGRPQLSNVGYTYDEKSHTIRISVTDDRAKTRNLRRDPRASLYVSTPDLGAYLIAEGDAELTPVTTDPQDATADELVEVYRAISGEHPDWDEYRAAMVTDRRLVVRLRVTKVYGWGREAGGVSLALDE